MRTWLALAVVAAAVAPTLATVPVSATCRAAAQAWLGTQPAAACAAQLDEVLSNGTLLSLCTAVPSNSFPQPPFATRGVPLDCMSPLSLMAQPRRNIVTPPALADSRFAGSCPLCAASMASCRPLLFSLAQASLDSSSAPASLAAASAACAGATDSLALTMLRLQSEIVCASSDSLGVSLLPGGYLDGVLDMRTLTQCGKCAATPCTPGMYCAQNVLPELCASGNYCPNAATKIVCPADHFCPEGSTEPIACRSTAAGSCPAGASREVVWVPLFIAVLMMLGAVALRMAARRGAHPALVALCGSRAGGRAAVVPASGRTTVSAARQHAEGLTVKFSHLRLVSGTNVRITDATGVITPGKLTAVIGGSGAGKTSLMNVLLGRERATAGKVTFLPPAAPGSDVPPTPLRDSEMARLIGFVPQTDVMLRDLTIYNLLEHSARSRLPPSIDAAGITSRVEDVLARLGIGHLRHAVVGDGGSGSLSSGERKLVNIGLELVAEPRALFLDEPTTGLDASSVMTVAHMLANIASTGLTVVAVVHQPRAEVFRLLDEIVVLVPGGRVAFLGPAQASLRYFAEAGHSCAADANKTDFLIDLVSGALPGGTAGDVDFAAMWEERGPAFVASVAVAEGKLEGKVAAGVVEGSLPDRPGFALQTFLFFHRALMQRLVGSSALIDMGSHLIGGCVIGIVTSGGPLFLPPIPLQYVQACPPGSEVRCATWLRMMVEPATFYLTMVLGALGVPPAVRTFGREKEVFAREAYVGIHPIAYFLGKVAADVPYFILTSFLFLAPVVAIAPWRGPTTELFAICVAISIFIQALGNALSLAIADPDSATLVGVITAILLNLFGGFVPRLGDGAVWAYTRWSARAIVAVELGHGQLKGSLYSGAFNSLIPEEHADPDYGTDLGHLLLFAAVTHAASLVLLLRTNRARKGLLL